MKKFLCAALLGAAAAAGASTKNYVLDGGVTNIVKGDWTNLTHITIGSTSSVNRLEVDRNSFVSNVNVTVGESADADNNSVLVSDSEWVMTGDLTVGEEGSDNRFRIDGSQVTVYDDVYVGAEAGANGNTLIVTDDDAYLTAETLYVGAAGNTGNVVSVSDGGTVQVTNLQISAGNDFNLEDDGTLKVNKFDASQDGFNWYDGGALTVSVKLEGFDTLSGSNKTLRLNGADWKVGGDLTVSGVSNSLYAVNGADITSEDVIIGGDGSEEISVVITGSKTEWDASGTITVDGGVSNSLYIGSGAAVTSASASLGGGGAQGTAVTITGDGTTWEVDGLFSVGDGGSNTLVYLANGAVLESGTGRIGGDNSYSNVVYLTDEDTEWLINDGELTVTGESNKLVVTDGAAVVVGNANSDKLGEDGGILVSSSSSAASLTVSGTSSVLTDGSRLVGLSDDSTGSVTITNGGTIGAAGVYIDDASELNLNAGGTLEVYADFDASQDGFNWNDGSELNVSYGELTGLDEINYQGDYYALVSGSNKTLVIGFAGVYDNSADMLAVGWEDDGGSSLLITNGGSVEAESLYVGYNSDSNTVLVAGDGSVLDLDSELYVGYSNSVGNTVIISNGASVAAESFTVESNNTVYLGDDGSLTVSGDFTVEETNGLVWGQAELAVSGELSWDVNLDQSYQTLTLTGDDAVWNRSASDLIIGTSGTGNVLRISSGASVTNADAVVGQLDTAYSNQVVVTGTDSTWVNTGTLTIGNENNSSNRVTVSSGGLVSADVLEINGNNDFNLNSGGTLEITGSFDAAQEGFNWNESGALVISTNAVVYDIGRTDGTNRTLTVNAGTLDNSTNTLIWGRSGYGSDMVVSNGSTMLSAGAVIGYSSEADENTITLSGSGTSWTNSGQLVVGLDGSENILTISESSTVYTATAYIGSGTSASYNEVVVTGSNSLLQVDTDLVVGVLGSDNALTISDNGTVSNTAAVVGLGGDDNEVLVTSTGLWSTVSLLVGADAVTLSTNYTSAGGVTVITITSNTVESSGNSVTVEDGGRVETEELVIEDDNYFYLEDGGTLYVDTSVFNITNEQYEGLEWNTGGNLALTGELLGMDTTNLDVSASSTSNTFGYLSDGRILTLDGPGASWTNENLIVGYDGSDKTGLVLTNGAWVSQATTYIGWEDTANNYVVVASNSVMTSTSNLYVGVYHDDDGELQQAGSGNSLSVSNGGWVFVGSLSTNDFAADESGMAVASTNGAEMIVGNDGDVLIEDSLWIGYSNLLGYVIATNGGSVTTESLYISDGSYFNIDDGGRLYVTGDYNYEAQTNVNWNEGGELAVGGTLTGYYGMFSSNQTLSIDGSNAVWNLGTDQLVIGSSGDDNSLYILNGGTVINGDAIVGRDITSDGNLVYVSDSNSVWNVQGTLYIGTKVDTGTLSGNNAENYVIVADNGTVKAEALQIATNNAFYLNDGGTLEMQGDFDLSADGHDGLEWNSGGNLAVKGTLTGMPSTNLFNGNAKYLTNGWHLTLLDGGNWTVQTNLIVGIKSSSALLTVTNAGSSAVVNSNAFVGWGSAGKNNGVYVGDNGSFAVGSNLYIGAYYDEDDEDELIYSGSGNYVIQTNGGWVTLGDFDKTGLTGGVGIGTNRTLVVGNGSLYAYDGIYIDGGTNWVMTNGTVTTTSIELEHDGAFELYGSLNMLGDLDAGMDGFNWNSGGQIYITNGVLRGVDLLDGTGKVLTVEQSWWTNNGFTVTGSNHTISIVNSSKVYSASSVQIGSISNQDSLVQIMNTGTVWTVSGGFTVGASNDLSVTDSGSLLIDGSLSLGSGSVFTMDTSAVVRVQSDMFISNATLSGAGTIQFTNVNNLLSIAGSNTVIGSDFVFDAGDGDDTLYIFDNWNFEFSSNTETQFVGFETLQMSNATLSGSGTMDQFDSLYFTDGTFAPDGTLYLAADSITISGQPTLEITVYSAESNDLLRVDKDLEGVVMDAEITIADGIDDLEDLDAAILIADGGGVGGVFSSTNGASVKFIDHYLMYDFYLTNDTIYEVNVRSELKPGDEISSSLTYAGTETVRMGFSGMKDAVFTRVKQLRRNLVSTAHSMSQEAYLMTSTNAPAGAQGPGSNNTIFGMHLWAQYFSGQGSYDAHGNSYGFTLNNTGTTLGADRLFGENLTLGLNYTYVRGDADTTNDDSLDSETYWFGAYGEWVNNDGIYIDALAAYGASSYDSVRVEDSYYGTGSYRGSQFGTYVDVGQYLYYKNLALAPYVGINLLAMQMDGYTETEENGSEIAVDDSTRTIVESAVGLKGRYRFDTGRGRFQLTGFAEWTHDFVDNTVDSDIKASSLSTVTTSAINPAQDIIGTGLGFSWICTEYMEVGIGYNGRYSSDYEEHSGSLMLDIMF